MRKKQLRLYLKDENGFFYKVLGIFDEIDSYGEGFLKLVFSIKGTGKGFYRLPEITEISKDDLFQELTYHYQSGFFHGKIKKGKRAEKIEAPILNIVQKKTIVKFMEVTVHDLSILEKESPKVENSITIPFDKNQSLLFNLLFSFDFEAIRKIVAIAKGSLSEDTIMKTSSGLYIYFSFDYISKVKKVSGITHLIKPELLSNV